MVRLPIRQGVDAPLVPRMKDPAEVLSADIQPVAPETMGAGDLLALAMKTQLT